MLWPRLPRPLQLPAPGAEQLGVSQAIYYAKNIIAGTNTVTVTFNQNTGIQSVRIVEYAGLDPANPLDTSVGNTGTATTADSGPVTTNSANDLLFGAGTITTGFIGNGDGFTTVLLNGLGDIMEEQVVAAAGPYDATATLGRGGWVMQLVAFRATGQTPPTFAAPTITSVSPTSGPEAGGIALTLTGTNFEPGAAVVFSNAASFTAAGVNCTRRFDYNHQLSYPIFPDRSSHNQCDQCGRSDLRSVRLHRHLQYAFLYGDVSEHYPGHWSNERRHTGYHIRQRFRSGCGSDRWRPSRRPRFGDERQHHPGQCASRPGRVEDSCGHESQRQWRHAARAATHMRPGRQELTLCR